MTEVDLYILEQELKYVHNPKLNLLVNKLLIEREQLIRKVNTDPLTGLYNRRVLEDVITCGIVLMIDVDNFKNINDTLGHAEGDYIIKGVAKILQDSFRMTDYVIRWGGDEFLVAFMDKRLDIIIDRIKDIKELIKTQLNGEVTLSIGIGINRGQDTMTELLLKADRALYISKENGKDQTSIYEEDPSIKLERRRKH